MSLENTVGMTLAQVAFYSVMEYHPKSKEAPVADGHRRIIITYKAPKDGPYKGQKPQAVYCDVHQRRIAAEPAILVAALQAKFEQLEEQLVRKLINDKYSWKDRKHTKLNISSDEITVDAIAAFAEATGLGRLSGESIKSWFESVAVVPLSGMIAAKKGLAPDADAVVEGVAAFGAHFQSLASTKVALSMKVAQAMLKVCAQLRDAASEEEDDPMLTKLEGIIEPFAKPDESVADMI